MKTTSTFSFHCPHDVPKGNCADHQSITAREIFRTHPEVKKMLWGGKFWTTEYYTNTVGHCGNEKMIKNMFNNKAVHTGNS